MTPEDFEPTLRDAISKTRIDADIAQSIVDTASISLEELMIMLLPQAASFARTSLSNFNVGVVVLGASGNLYMGSNMEFAGQALGFSVHGEQTAINHAWLSGETRLLAIAINAAPCGHCRQFMTELVSHTGALQLFIKNDPNDTADLSFSRNPLSHFLPDAFGPSDLGVSDRLMAGMRKEFQIFTEDSLAMSALAAANNSYAPYTGTFSGVDWKLEMA